MASTSSRVTSAATPVRAGVRSRAVPENLTRLSEDRPTTGLFALTLFLAAALLFSVQPLTARALLPALGGSPAVWNTCMVFFQAALLAGYAYGHALASRLGVRAQAVVHGLVVLAPLAVLPLALEAAAADGPAPGDSPVGWLLMTLLTTVGLPFFVVATTAPLLQHWFARTGGLSSGDPYFLYGASNLGSMTALLAYPLAVEPALRLSNQSRAWAASYALLAALVLACAAVVWRRGATGAAAEAAQAEPVHIGLMRRLRWVTLAFVPSSLLLGVTTYLSTDVAAIPLLWVVPLALYLLTFILVFARRPFPAAEFGPLLPMVLALLAWTMMVGPAPGFSILALHLCAFFVAALVCHGALAADRPPADGLTGFYLAMSLGGVLGGLFNALVAPVVFDRVVEYPLMLAPACLALAAVGRPGPQTVSRPRWVWGLFAASVLIVVLGRGWRVPICTEGAVLKLAAGVAAGLAWTLGRGRPARLAGLFAALFLVSGLPGPGEGRVLDRDRNFFGVVRVGLDPAGETHRLVHGSTLHGAQSLRPDRRNVPLTYYHPTGPVGDLFRALDAQGKAEPRVAVVGLGAGSMAAYARPGARWTFYEIDPAVVRIAADPRFFSFLADSPAGPPEILLGDARLRLREAPEGSLDLLVLDAFSSDAIPLHLLTREALCLYRSRLAPDGILAFHISNRYINLHPVVAALARDAGLACRIRADLAVSTDPNAPDAGKSPSIWAALSADSSALPADPRWIIPAPSDAPVWADDYNDVVRRLFR